MHDISSLTVDQNLQSILDRYSMVGADSDPAGIDITNADRKYLGSFDARKGHLYGELTTCGLVLVWATPEKSDNCTAEVLVVEHGSLVAATHIYNRRSGEYDWRDDTGVYASIPLNTQTDSLVSIPDTPSSIHKPSKRDERVLAAHTRVAKTLAKLAAASDEYDALHQTVTTRYKLVPKNLEQLYPYAGHTYGPRVNLQEMLSADISFHPAVVEALQLVPEMMTDS